MVRSGTSSATLGTLGLAHLGAQTLGRPDKLGMHALHIRVQLGHLLLEPQHALHARRIQSELGELLNAPQTSTSSGVQARVLGRASRSSRPRRSYMRSVCGCMAANSAATRYVQRPVDWSCSAMAHLLAVTPNRPARGSVWRTAEPLDQVALFLAELGRHDDAQAGQQVAARRP